MEPLVHTLSWRMMAIDGAYALRVAMQPSIQHTVLWDAELSASFAVQWLLPQRPDRHHHGANFAFAMSQCCISHRTLHMMFQVH